MNQKAIFLWIFTKYSWNISISIHQINNRFRYSADLKESPFKFVEFKKIKYKEKYKYKKPWTIGIIMNKVIIIATLVS